MKKFWAILLLIGITLFLTITLYNRELSNSNEFNQGEKQEFNDAMENEEQNLNDPTQFSEPNVNQENYTLSDSQGAVDIAISFENLIEDDSENLIFKVMLNTHSINLDALDMTKLATLESDHGLKINDGFMWEHGDGAGHHIYGFLKIPKVYNGKNIIGSSTNSITLTITGLDGDQSSEFTWDKEQLDKLTK